MSVLSKGKDKFREEWHRQRSVLKYPKCPNGASRFHQGREHALRPSESLTEAYGCEIKVLVLGTGNFGWLGDSKQVANNACYGGWGKTGGLGTCVVACDHIGGYVYAAGDCYIGAVELGMG